MDLLTKLGITDERSYKKWVVRNHPDKGGDSAQFVEVKNLFEKKRNNQNVNYNNFNYTNGFGGTSSRIGKCKGGYGNCPYYATTRGFCSYHRNYCEIFVGGVQCTNSKTKGCYCDFHAPKKASNKGASFCKHKFCMSFPEPGKDGYCKKHYSSKCKYNVQGVRCEREKTKGDYCDKHSKEKSPNEKSPNEKSSNEKSSNEKCSATTQRGTSCKNKVYKEGLCYNHHRKKSQPPPEPKEAPQTQQCKGITKSGARCKRMTTDEYCNSHTSQKS